MQQQPRRMIQALQSNIGKAIVGKEEAIEYALIALLCKVLNCVCDCCCTGCYCKCCGTTFKCCNSLLEYIFCRVCQTSVDITCICKSETSGCVIAVSEYVGRCLVDRYCSCICNRIRAFLSYVKL